MVVHVDDHDTMRRDRMSQRLSSDPTAECYHFTSRHKNKCNYHPPSYSEAIYNAQYDGNFSSQHISNPQSGVYPPGGCFPKSEPYQPQPGHSQPQTAYGQPQHGQQHNTQAYTSQPSVTLSQRGGPGHLFVHPRPPNYMAASILVCLCCCFPTGLCAIYLASQANELVSKGDMEGARRKSNIARTLMIASIVFGIIWFTGVILFRVYVFGTRFTITYCEFPNQCTTFSETG